MRTTTTPVRLSALALAAALTLGACTTGDDGTQDTAGADAGTDAQSTEDAATTQEALDTEALPDPVAEVNGEQITKDEFVTVFETQLVSLEQQAQMSGMPVDQMLLRDEVIDLLVDSELLQQEGERLEVEVGEDQVDAELDTLAEQNGAASSEELLALFEEQGVTEEQVREELGRIVLIDELIEQRGGVDEPDEQELKDYYEEITGQSADGDEASSTGGPDAGSATADPAAAPPYEQVRDQIAAQLEQERANELLTELLEELRGDADITTHV